MRSADEPTVVEDDGPSDPSVSWIAGRYRLGPLIGRGGAGVVHEAFDHRLGRVCAVKLVPARLGEDDCRERVALRLLRIPGVVRLHDDGEDRGQRFLVMDLVSGGPFAGPGGWAVWRERVVALLRTLGQVHCAGVVHRDLKPSNVLLDGDGRPLLTDFGLAEGHRVADPAVGRFEGTPRYMAPEQRRGEACDGRADLYAVGVMVRELIGDDAPPEVGRLVRALLAEDRDDRPASAWAALGMLGVRRPPLLPGSSPNPMTVDVLARALGEPPLTFLGVERVAAEQLVADTGGEPGRLREALDGWYTSGVIRVDGGRTTIDGPSFRRWALRDLPVEAAITLAKERQDIGDHPAVLELIDAVMPECRNAPSTRKELARMVARAALAIDERSAVETALSSTIGVDVEATRVLDGYRARSAGEHARAASLLARPIEDDDELEIHRQGLLLRVVERPDEHLAVIAAWARANLRRTAKWHGWRGNAAYRAGRWAEAAKAHERSLSGKRWANERLTTLTNLAAARLELGQHDLAEAGFATVAAEGRAARLGAFVGTATVLGRVAAYRAGRAEVPDLDLVDAAAELGRLEGVAALTEGAVAWRAGDPRAATLAVRAGAVFERTAEVGPATLAAALAVAAGRRELVPACVRALPTVEDPLIAAQVAGLLAVPVDPGVLDRITVRRSDRLDVLSLDEVFRRIGRGRAGRAS